MHLRLLAFACCAFLAFAAAGESPPPAGLARFVAIDNVCAWPNLTLMPDGSVNATIFGKPSHGQMAGAVECWNSVDGQFWEQRGIPAPNEPETNRMNVAAGLAKNGDLLVLCSGWSNVPPANAPKRAAFRDQILPLWICRSADGGRTWSRLETFPLPDPGWNHYVPFGDIKQGADGSLHASCYNGRFKNPAETGRGTSGSCSWHFRSDDDGKTWVRTGAIHPAGNETALLHLGAKRWLAAARAANMDLFTSEDDGQTWTGPTPVTQKNEINGHLARLSDNRILLTYGSRVKAGEQFGVLAKVSQDDGQTWSEPIRIAHTTTSDCGYPSTVQRADGKLVTAWYAAASAYHARYHMGVAIWAPPAS